MIFTKIWERYFLIQFLKIFFLFLLCFYGLYVIVDYASHTSALPHHSVHIQKSELIRYYLFVFASRAEVLLPVALLIALIKTVSTLNVQGELVALVASGFSMKRLMSPFLFIGALCTLILFLNEEWLLPTALTKLRHLEEGNRHHRTRAGMIAHHIFLEDGSLFIYQDYDAQKEQFYDSYWISSLNDVYRIKFLFPKQQTGYFVDHLVRGTHGKLDLVESFSSLTFPHIHFQKTELRSTLLDADALSLSHLFEQLPTLQVQDSELSEMESKIKTAFYWKLTLPWLCLFAIIAPIPFCICFSRQLPFFLLYVVGIFGLLAFYLFLDAALVIAKRQVLSPEWAIVLPFLTVFSVFSWRFIRHC